MSAQKNSGKTGAEAAASGEGQQIRVALNSARLRTSYANVFQTRCTAEEIILTQDGGTENVLAVDLDRRIVMTPASAQRLLLALDSTLREHAARFSGNCPQG
ncbi:MAG: DUF3467 domain-containing protein [Desulfovibrio sp.]|uniref:DUF3467 domain-containing protein n=1 Tax=Desulfovibrio sp. TaxID=885 RepID=UPI0025BEF90A|nr:DUF3467 domain-containing protein [Desulfovibrio sp.]MBS6829766.1 DUF3467 domain-containing protein [Desulfovibrio sp.]